jgi:hypothetical protein
MVMNSSDSNTDEPAPDSRLRDGLRSLPIPETPPALESRVRHRIRRRRVQRAALASGAATLTLVVALLLWQPWSDGPASVVQHPQPAPPVPSAPPSEIPADELAVLFAAPPVDSLTVLDRQDKGFVAALNRLEDVK